MKQCVQVGMFRVQEVLVLKQIKRLRLRKQIKVLILEQANKRNLFLKLKGLKIISYLPHNQKICVT